jgi:hypothetical protein
MTAFQSDAFQDNAFQIASLNVAVPAFQRCAFQFGAFQVLPCAETQPTATGGIIRRKRKPRLDLAEPPTRAERDDEREQLGIIPRRVKTIIRRLAEQDVETPEPDEAALSRALRVELARQRIAYQTLYDEALMQMREALVREEIRALLLAEQSRQMAKSEEDRRQRAYKALMQREEEDILFLLMFA